MTKKIFLLILLSVFITFPLYSQERGNKDDAVKLVKDFIDYFNKYGAEKAFAEVQNPQGKFRVKDLYIFVHKTADNEAAMLAHGANPALVSRDVYNMKDADGNPFVHKFRDVFLSEKGEGWVDYKWPYPITGKIEKKATFIKRINDEIYAACGISSLY